MGGRCAPGARVAGISWPEVETRLNQGATALLPVAAAAKEHGRHLPMATDLLQAEWLVDQLLGRRNLLVWPTLNYGFYPAFTDYPGSISLSRDTFVAVVSEVLQGIVDAGATRIAILNTGISTIRPIDAAVATLPPDPSIKQIDVYSGPRYAEAERALVEQSWGGHADESETSIMLAIAPDAVNMAHAEPAVKQIESGRLNRTNPRDPSYSPSGVNGDPTRATVAKGGQLMQAILADILAAIDADAVTDKVRR